ncbi:MAG: Hpt domain-containing protein [Elusimicrobiota bacterium]
MDEEKQTGKNAGEFGPEVMEEYFADCRENLAKARSWLRDLETEGTGGGAAPAAKLLKRYGHQLAGSGGTYDLPRLGEAGVRLDALMHAVLSGSQPLDRAVLVQAAVLLDDIEKFLRS